MNIKKKRQLILDAAENSIDELIKVLNRKMDPQEIDPEKVKISASAYRLAMDDAIIMLERVEDIKALLDETPEKDKENASFFGVETRAK